MKPTGMSELSSTVEKLQKKVACYNTACVCVAKAITRGDNAEKDELKSIYEIEANQYSDIWDDLDRINAEIIKLGKIE